VVLTTSKNNILQVARKAFEQETGVDLELAWADAETPELHLKAPGAQIKMNALILAGGIAANALLVLLRRQQHLKNQIIVLPQVTADMADILRKDNVQFIDTAGNGFINQPPIYLFVKGNKAKNIESLPTTRRAFKQTGLRVLYAFLCQPGLENETYRTIAEKTKVALGMVNWVVKDLEELGFLIRTGKAGRARQLRLIEKERLLERWITAYAEQLRPKLLLGRYRGAAGWWQEAMLKPQEAQWGGEVAAAKLTDYLKPATETVYVDRDNLAAFLRKNRLQKDPQGEVEILARFWQLETIPPNRDMVHPLLVYADLMATGNQRNIETARMIYDQHIVQLIRED
jgi:hypothetical protein